MRAATTIEPRFFPRTDLDVPARVVFGASEFNATLVNVSEGGALIRGVGESTVGEMVALEFRLPGIERPLKASGEVVWRGPDGGIGLRFGELSEADLIAIRSFVDQRDPMVWDGAAPLPRELAVRFVPVIKRQAYRIARRLPAHIEVDDLVGAGFLALVDAYSRFNPAQGYRFEPFALVRIRGAMLDELRGSDPVSRSMRRRKREVDAAAHRLQSVLGRQPDDEEIATHLGLSIDDYRACLDAVSVGRHASLDEDGDRDESVHPIQPVTGMLDPEQQLSDAENALRIVAAKAALPERLRRVLEMYYGEELSMRSIGAVLGVTEARISQLISKAVQTLRAEVSRTGAGSIDEPQVK